ncbi:MAG: sigma-70 family RNA polymerase sigma factor [Planctomycetota bacterium]
MVERQQASSRAPASAPGPTGGSEPSWPLTAAIARGDERAFARFYDLWFDRLVVLVRSLTRRDEAFCLDVAQDCMLRVVRRLPALRREEEVAAWMARAALRLAVDHLRRERRRARREQAVGGQRPEPPGVADDLLHRERAAWLERRIAELPDGDRALLAARFEAGRTLEQVGDGLGMSGHAAHGRIRRLVERLRRAAEEVFS